MSVSFLASNLALPGASYDLVYMAVCEELVEAFLDIYQIKEDRLIQRKFLENLMVCLISFVFY